MRKGRSKVLFSVMLAALLLAVSLPMVQAETIAPNNGQGYQSELYYGKYNDNVQLVKQQLKVSGYYHGLITPWFNRDLEAAVKEFQGDYGLTQTGRVDAATWNALFSRQAAKQPAQQLPQNPVAEQPENLKEQQLQQTWLEELLQQKFGAGNYKIVYQSEGRIRVIYYPVPQPKPEPEPQPQPEPAPQPAPGLTAAEQQMIDLLNQERVSRGLNPLKVDLDLVKTARMKSQDLINNNYFGHQSPTYGSPFDLMKSLGISYRLAGENLAGASTVQRAHTALMNSPGHRANILNPDYTHIGIGIVAGGPYGMMFTQHFVGR